LEAVLYALSGFLMKLSDDAHDKRNNTIFAIFAGLLCVACIAYLAVTSADAATIFIAILIGNFLSWKVDSINHMVSFIILMGILIILGIPTIGIITLAVCSAAAFLDEIGNDNPWVSRHGKILEFFFDHRFTLKIAVLLFAVLGIFQTVFPALKIPGVQYFQFQTFIYFLFFEICYEIAGLKFDTIYDGLYRIFRVFSQIN